MSEYLKKRYPSKGEFPKEEGIYHAKYKTGEYHGYIWKFYADDEDNKDEKAWMNKHVEYWLNDFELPSNEEIIDNFKTSDQWDAINWFKSKLGL
jgi:hypothetical protein